MINFYKVNRTSEEDNGVRRPGDQEDLNTFTRLPKARQQNNRR